jgi:hypothetical protein
MTAITIRQVSDLATFLLPPYFEPFTRVFGALAPTGQTRSFAISFIHCPKQGPAGPYLPSCVASAGCIPYNPCKRNYCMTLGLLRACRHYYLIHRFFHFEATARTAVGSAENTFSSKIRLRRASKRVSDRVDTRYKKTSIIRSSVSTFHSSKWVASRGCEPGGGRSQGWIQYVLATDCVRPELAKWDISASTT